MCPSTLVLLVSFSISFIFALGVWAVVLYLYITGYGQ